MTSTPTRHGIRLPLALAAAAVAALAISVGVFVHSAQPTQILGVAAALYGVAGALSVLLQARQMLVRRASCDVSARFLATYAGGYAI
jgi:membrane associated rhomboid family serine protease